MKHVLVDTDIVIDFLKTDTGLIEELLILQAEGNALLYITSLSLFELYSGLEPQAEYDFQEFIANFIQADIDRPFLTWAGKQRKQLNKKVPVIDFLIQARAVYDNLQLATRNMKHHKDLLDVVFYTPKN